MIQAIVIGWLKGRAAQWLKAYWKPLLCVFVVVVIYLAGWANGIEAERRDWKDKFAALEEEAQALKDAQAAASVQSAKEREAWRVQHAKALESVKRRLAHEIKNNRVYDDCHAGDEFLRLYEESAGRAGAGTAAR